MYAIAMTITAPFVGIILDKCSHKVVLITGVLLESTSVMSFGFINRLESNV